MNSEKTAIRRAGPSRPLKDIISFLKDNDMEVSDFSWLDYGCGKGEDILHLKSCGAEAIGYDPYYNPVDIGEKKFDIVTCTYVLNVIDDIELRIGALRSAWERVSDDSGTLAIFVREEKEINKEAEENEWKQHKDGFVTSKDTFQVGFNFVSLNRLLSHVVPYKQAGMAVDFSRNGYISILVRKNNQPKETIH